MSHIILSDMAGAAATQVTVAPDFIRVKELR